MHSIPSVTLAPNGDFFAGQSMDNSIVVYQCGEKVKKLGRKVFRGHTNIGYACQIGFSPNSKFIISGDSTGKLHVWDWKTVKVIIDKYISYLFTDLLINLSLLLAIS